MTWKAIIGSIPGSGPMWSNEKAGVWREYRDRFVVRGEWVLRDGKPLVMTPAEAEKLARELGATLPNSLASGHLRFYAAGFPLGTLKAIEDGTWKPRRQPVAPGLEDDDYDWAAEDEHDRMLDEWDAEYSRRREHDV